MVIINIAKYIGPSVCIVKFILKHSANMPKCKSLHVRVDLREISLHSDCQSNTNRSLSLGQAS